MRKLMQLVTRLALRYHRWIGFVAALPLLLWGISGLSHPIMTRLQPQPAAMMPPAVLLASVSAEERAALPPLAQLLAASDIPFIESARLLQWQGKPVWQLTLPGQPERRYVDARTGVLLSGLDEQIAVLMARHYTGHAAGEGEREIASVQLVTAFSDDYLYVNRLLPVWRVEFAGGDHLRAFVDTSPMRLATLDNTLKSTFGKIFRSLHSWTFIDNESLRDGLMTIFLLTAMCSSIGGLWLYAHYFRRAESGARALPARRWHRRIGLVASVTTLMFTVSAILHLLMIEKTASEAVALPAGDMRMDVSALQVAPAALPLRETDSLQLLSLQGQPVWRASPPSRSMVGKMAGKMPEDTQSPSEHEHHHGQHKMQAAMDSDRYFSAADGSEIPDGPVRHARALAAAFSGLSETAVTAVEKITKFEGEYGFINKRLPVYKVSLATPDHLAVYVETSTGLKAAEVRDPKRVEGFTFAYLHKWHMLDALGKDIRDAVAGLMALLIVVMVLLGVRLVLWRRPV